MSIPPGTDRGAGPSAADAGARADALLDVRRWDEARRLVGDALARHPDDWGLWVRAARASLGLDDLGRALTEAERACVLAPDREWPHRVRSLVLRTMNRTDDALAAALESVRLAPRSVEPYLVAGRAALVAGHGMQAFELASAAVALDPEDHRAHHLMGSVYSWHQRPAESERALRNALALQPDDAMTINNLGVALQQQGRESEAAELFMRAAGTDPGERLYRDNVANAGQRLRKEWAWVTILVVVATLRAGPFGLIPGLAFAVWYRRHRRRKLTGADGQRLPELLWQVEREARRQRWRKLWPFGAAPDRWGIAGVVLLTAGVVDLVVLAFVDHPDERVLVAGLAAMIAGLVLLLRFVRGRR